MEKEKTLPTGLKTMQLNDQKAGMEGLDKEMINKIIFEASKGTPFFTFQEKRQKTIDSKVNELLTTIKKITENERKDCLERMNALGISLESERDLSHSIVHIDMDAYYAAVEMQDNPKLKEQPMAVGSSSMLSTSNYHARKYGVRAAMPGFIAKKLCPELIIVPTNFDKYKKVSSKIRNIIKEYDPDFCPASLDEVYLDLTEFIRKKYKKDLHNNCCLKNDIYDSFSDENNSEGNDENDYEACLTCSHSISDERRDQMAYDIVNEIREKIYKVTELTASAGIAPNTMLAKVCSDQNKPNGQYQICSTTDAVKAFISTLPVKKVSGIGPVQGQILNAIGIHTCADMWDKRDLVGNLFSPTSVDFYMRVALGIGNTTVKSDHIRKSIGVEHTFREIHLRADLHKKCQELTDEMIDDLKTHRLLGKVVVLKIKTTNFETHTRNQSLAYHTADSEIISKAAKKLLDAEIAAVSPQPLRLRLMGMRMANLVHEDDAPDSKKPFVKLKDFLLAKSSSTGKLGSPSKCEEMFTCPVCFEKYQINFNEFQDHVNECINNQNVETSLDECKELSLSSISLGQNSEYCETAMNFTDECNNSTSGNSNEEVHFYCPVCTLDQNVNNLTELNMHIDSCLNKVTIKEILEFDSSLERKRKLPLNKKQTTKKPKVVKKERKIDDYFQ